MVGISTKGITYLPSKGYYRVDGWICKGVFQKDFYVLHEVSLKFQHHSGQLFDFERRMERNTLLPTA